jgi:hypothetical protein
VSASLRPQWLLEVLYTLVLSICFLGGLWLMLNVSVDYLWLMLLGLVTIGVRGGMELQKRLSSR